MCVTLVICNTLHAENEALFGRAMLTHLTSDSEHFKDTNVTRFLVAALTLTLPSEESASLADVVRPAC